MAATDPFAGLKLAAARKAEKEKKLQERGGGMRSFLNAAVECAPLPQCGPSLKGAVLPCVGTRSAVKAITPRKKRRQPQGSPLRGSPRWAACCVAPTDPLERVNGVKPGRVELPTEPDKIEHRVGDFPAACVREIADANFCATPLAGRRRLHVETPWKPDSEDAAGYLALRMGDTIVLTAETEPDWWSGYVEPREWIV
jgi:hypothetical protein